MREFVDMATNAAKIACRKNNCKDLAIFAKKVGSNFLLQNKRIEFCPIPPHDALAARPFAARAYPSDLLVCTIWDDVRTYLTSSIDLKEKVSLIIALAHFKKEEKL